MKTFESLFAELSEKAQTRPEGSLTVDELDKDRQFSGQRVALGFEDARLLFPSGEDDQLGIGGLGGALCDVQIDDVRAGNVEFPAGGVDELAVRGPGQQTAGRAL